jgi:transcriptional regulator with XRE-family HTH domain
MDPMHGKPILAAQLRAGRAILGLSQAELAQRAGLPIEAIARGQRLMGSRARPRQRWQPFRRLLRGEA